MKKHKNILVKSKDRKRVNEISQFLHNLADKISDKKIIFTHGDHESEIALPENVILSVIAKEKATSKKGKISKLTLGLKWSEGLDVNSPLGVK